MLNNLKRYIQLIRLKNRSIEYGDADNALNGNLELLNHDNIHNVYRLVCVNNLLQQSFILERPNNMSQSDCFKVISYVKQKIDNSIVTLDKQINIIEYMLVKFFGFRAITDDEVKGRTIVDLYLINKNENLFMNSRFYINYFNWYTNTFIDDREIINIYENIDSSIANVLKIKFSNK